jgi:tRNA G18 (ribose-2'-O)-methylase SpoU
MPAESPASALLLQRFAAARLDPTVVVVEGFHAIKHALRFGATIDLLLTSDRSMAANLVKTLAPDIGPALDRAELVGADLFDRLTASPPETRILAIARRPAGQLDRALAGPGAAPVVWLESPSHIGNIGAAVRVAAAAGAAALVTTGVHDPWHPAALRGSAGLHFALPVDRVDALPASDRPLIAIDGLGEPLGPGSLPDRAVLAFGCERRGISPELRARADHLVSIPMQPGVSSLNLATAVAVTLYAWRLGLAPRS